MNAIQRLANGNLKTGREEKEQMLYEEIGICNARCRDCIYGNRNKTAMINCNFILMEGHRRPCPAGKGCTEFIRFKSKKKKVKKNDNNMPKQRTGKADN